MRSEQVAAVLGIPKERQYEITNTVDDCIHDFFNLGLFNEEMMLQVVAHRLRNFSKQEIVFGTYYVGRIVGLLNEATDHDLKVTKEVVTSVFDLTTFKQF
jgi:hypothetical protein